MAKSLKKVASFAAPIIGAAVGGPAGAAIGGGIGGAISGGGLKGVGLGALTGYAGNAIGGSLAESLSGTLGKAGASSLGSVLGKTSSNAIGNTLLNTTFAEGLGKFAGNQIAGSLADSLLGTQDQINVPNYKTKTPSTQSTPFEAKQEPQLQLPNSLSGLSGLDPMQQSSNIATQGVYGGGVGQQEQDYYTNLINRRLVDETGKVDTNFNDLSAIDNSYLSQIGLGGYSNPSSLLEAIYGRKKQAYA